MSGDRYIIKDQNAAYFLTLTVVDWVDVFTRPEHKMAIVDSLNYCSQNKGLKIYAWCLMSNHLHLIAEAVPNYHLSDILRDFKKFTAKAIIKQIVSEPESRKDWMLFKFKYAAKYLKRVKTYKFWQDSNHAIILDDHKIFDQKINYIHKNPVKSMIVEEPENYLFSSARDYAGIKGFVDIEFAD